MTECEGGKCQASLDRGHVFFHVLPARVRVLGHKALAETSLASMMQDRHRG